MHQHTLEPSEDGLHGLFGEEDWVQNGSLIRGPLLPTPALTALPLAAPSNGLGTRTYAKEAERMSEYKGALDDLKSGFDETFQKLIDWLHRNRLLDSLATIIRWYAGWTPDNALARRAARTKHIAANANEAIAFLKDVEKAVRIASTQMGKRASSNSAGTESITRFTELGKSLRAAILRCVAAPGAHSSWQDFEKNLSAVLNGEWLNDAHSLIAKYRKLVDEESWSPFQQRSIKTSTEPSEEQENTHRKQYANGKDVVLDTNTRASLRVVLSVARQAAGILRELPNVKWQPVELLKQFYEDQDIKSNTDVVWRKNIFMMAQAVAATQELTSSNAHWDKSWNGLIETGALARIALIFLGHTLQSAFPTHVGNKEEYLAGWARAWWEDSAGDGGEYNRADAYYRGVQGTKSRRSIPPSVRKNAENWKPEGVLIHFRAFASALTQTEELENAYAVAMLSKLACFDELSHAIKGDAASQKSSAYEPKINDIEIFISAMSSRMRAICRFVRGTEYDDPVNNLDILKRCRAVYHCPNGHLRPEHCDLEFPNKPRITLHGRTPGSEAIGKVSLLESTPPSPRSSEQIVDTRPHWFYAYGKAPHEHLNKLYVAGPTQNEDFKAAMRLAVMAFCTPLYKAPEDWFCDTSGELALYYTLHRYLLNDAQAFKDLLFPMSRPASHYSTQATPSASSKYFQVREGDSK